MSIRLNSKLSRAVLAAALSVVLTVVLATVVLPALPSTAAAQEEPPSPLRPESNPAADVGADVGSDAPDPPCGTLTLDYPNNIIAKGESLTSCNGKYSLTAQDDGNTVIKRNEDGTVLWSTNTAGSPLDEFGICITGVDGYSGSRCLIAAGLDANNNWSYPWSTNVEGDINKVELRGGGDLVALDAEGNTLWQTNTGEQDCGDGLFLSPDDRQQIYDWADQEGQSRLREDACKALAVLVGASANEAELVIGDGPATLSAGPGAPSPDTNCPDKAPEGARGECGKPDKFTRDADPGAAADESQYPVYEAKYSIRFDAPNWVTPDKRNLWEKFVNWFTRKAADVKAFNEKDLLAELYVNFQAETDGQNITKTIPSPSASAPDFNANVTTKGAILGWEAERRENTDHGCINGEGVPCPEWRSSAQYEFGYTPIFDQVPIEFEPASPRVSITVYGDGSYDVETVDNSVFVE